MNNGKSHSATRTQDYLNKTGVKMVKQSPYSPDLNLCDRFLFTTLQKHCREKNMITGMNCTGTFSGTSDHDYQKIYWKKELNELLQHVAGMK